MRERRVNWLCTLVAILVMIFLVVPQARTTSAKCAGVSMLLSRCMWASTNPGSA